jgi:hypothetical protein
MRDTHDELPSSKWHARDYMTYFIFMGIVGSMGINEKRYRLYTMLPLRPQEVLVADMLYVLIVQLGMSALWILYLLFKPEDIQRETLGVVLANNALILTVIMLFGIHYHLAFFETKRYRRLNWLALVTASGAIVANAASGNSLSVAGFLRRHYASAPVAFALVLLWIGVSALSGEVFRRRKSYLA